MERGWRIQQQRWSIQNSVDFPDRVQITPAAIAIFEMLLDIQTQTGFKVILEIRRQVFSYLVTPHILGRPLRARMHGIGIGTRPPPVASSYPTTEGCYLFPLRHEPLRMSR